MSLGYNIGFSQGMVRTLLAYALLLITSSSATAPLAQAPPANSPDSSDRG